MSEPILYQWLLRNNQETCIPAFVVSHFRYTEEERDLLEEIECVECLYGVVRPIEESALSRGDNPIYDSVLDARDRAIARVRQRREENAKIQTK